MKTIRKKTFYLLMITAVSFFTAAAAAEVTIRLFSPAGYITPAILWKRSFKVVPSVFARSVLPQEEQTILSGTQQLAHISAKGYRGPDFTKSKPSGVIRVIVYGGSSVFDIHARGNDDWPHQAERLLKMKGISNVEIINAGILGHASYDCFGRFFAEGHLFEPDYVIWYGGWNDIKDFAANEPLLRRLQPLAANPLYHYQNPLDQFFCEISQLYVRLRYRIIMHQHRIGLEGVKPLTQSENIQPNALRQFKLTLELFADLAHNIGAIPVLALEAHLLHETNTSAENALIDYTAQPLTRPALLKSTVLVETMVREVSAAKKTLLIDASAAMSGQINYFSDHIHTNSAGSKKLAEITADFMKDEINKRSSERPGQTSVKTGA